MAVLKILCLFLIVFDLGIVLAANEGQNYAISQLFPKSPTSSQNNPPIYNAEKIEETTVGSFESPQLLERATETASPSFQNNQGFENEPKLIQNIPSSTTNDNSTVVQYKNNGAFNEQVNVLPIVDKQLTSENQGTSIQSINIFNATTSTVQTQENPLENSQPGEFNSNTTNIPLENVETEKEINFNSEKDVVQPIVPTQIENKEQSNDKVEENESGHDTLVTPLKEGKTPEDGSYDLSQSFVGKIFDDLFGSDNAPTTVQTQNDLIMTTTTIPKSFDNLNSEQVVNSSESVTVQGIETWPQIESNQTLDEYFQTNKFTEITTTQKSELTGILADWLQSKNENTMNTNNETVQNHFNNSSDVTTLRTIENGQVSITEVLSNETVISENAAVSQPPVYNYNTNQSEPTITELQPEQNVQQNFENNQQVLPVDNQAQVKETNEDLLAQTMPVENKQQIQTEENQNVSNNFEQKKQQFDPSFSFAGGPQLYNNNYQTAVNVTGNVPIQSQFENNQNIGTITTNQTETIQKQLETHENPFQNSTPISSDTQPNVIQSNLNQFANSTQSKIHSESQDPTISKTPTFNAVPQLNEPIANTYDTPLINQNIQPQVFQPIQPETQQNNNQQALNQQNIWTDGSLQASPTQSKEPTQESSYQKPEQTNSFLYQKDSYADSGGNANANQNAVVFTKNSNPLLNPVFGQLINLPNTSSQIYPSPVKIESRLFDENASNVDSNTTDLSVASSSLVETEIVSETVRPYFAPEINSNMTTPNIVRHELQIQETNESSNNTVEKQGTDTAEENSHLLNVTNVINEHVVNSSYKGQYVNAPVLSESKNLPVELDNAENDNINRINSNDASTSFTLSFQSSIEGNNNGKPVEEVPRKPYLSKRILNDDGITCMFINATVAVLKGGTVAFVPSNASVTGSCDPDTAFLEFIWPDRYNSQKNNSIYMTLSTNDNYYFIDSVNLKVHKDSFLNPYVIIDEQVSAGADNIQLLKTKSGKMLVCNTEMVLMEKDVQLQFSEITFAAFVTESLDKLPVQQCPLSQYAVEIGGGCLGLLIVVMLSVVFIYKCCKKKARDFKISP